LRIPAGMADPLRRAALPVPTDEIATVRVPLLVDWRLELVQIPVSDVDRAKAFYTEKAGFNADHDHRVSDEVRFVQLTPPGSTCSIALGPGSERCRRALSRAYSLWSQT
jgi:hypothetical protein